MKNKFLIGFAVVLLLTGVGYLLGMFLSRPITPFGKIPTNQAPESTVISTAQTVPENQADQSAPENAIVIKNTIILDVPFVVQAPFGNWDDPIFQNGCEEASILMAVNWLNGIQKVSPSAAQTQIHDIVDFENTTFGYNTDTDVFDVQKIFQDLFKKQNVSVQENIKLDDIKQELQNGNLVLVPAFGQALGNPNYTAPGPVEHMLVVIGYDPATREFITNDPGTRHGSKYRYGEDVFFDAIWGYPSGATAMSAPTGILKKAMIVVKK